MRVRIIFGLKNKGASIPFHHQNILANFIATHAKHYGQSDAYYNFSGLKGQIKISRMGLQFYSSRVTLVIASPDKDWIDALLRAIFAQPQVEIGNLLLIPEFVDIETPPTFSNQMKYICISPLVIVNPEQDNYHAKKFIEPEEDAFSDLLYETIMHQMEASKRYSPAELESFYKFQIVPDKEYLDKIKAEDKKFARIYTLNEGRNRYEFRGYTFPFELYAHEAVQKFVFECGLGSYTQQGYGMIDTVQAEATKQLNPYTF